MASGGRRDHIAAYGNGCGSGPATDLNTSSPTTIQPLNDSGDFLSASGTQTFVNVTAVPEPSTYVLLAIAGGIAAVAARRRTV